MATFDKAVTTEGLALLAALPAGQALTFTRVATGSGLLGEGQTLAGLTALIAEEQTFAVLAVRHSGDNFSVRFLLSNDGLSTGYAFTEYGVFVQDPEDAEAEILFLVGNSGATADSIPAEGESAYEASIDIQTVIANSSTVTVTFITGDAGNGKVGAYLQQYIHAASPVTITPAAMLAASPLSCGEIFSARGGFAFPPTFVSPSGAYTNQYYLLSMVITVSVETAVSIPVVWSGGSTQRGLFVDGGSNLLAPSFNEEYTATVTTTLTAGTHVIQWIIVGAMLVGNWFEDSIAWLEAATEASA